METMTGTIKSTKTILLVEDNPQDREATIRAFQKAKVANPIAQCENGDEALDYLFRRNKYSDPATSPRPILVLMDLNMPGTDGYQVLEELKKDPDLKKIPVIVMTTSSDERDVDRCYKAGANSYICKPVAMDGFLNAIGRLKEFWLEIAILPNTES